MGTVEDGSSSLIGTDGTGAGALRSKAGSSRMG